MTDVLHGWRRRFRTKNYCPWPGPRPLGLPSELEDATPEELERERAEAKRQLRGRGREIAELAAQCVSNDLIVVHGHSGVGKSSVLNVGLVPQLKAMGKIVVLCRDWGVTDDASPSGFVTAGAVRDGLLPDDPFAGELDDLDRKYPNKLVVVLDQFEELIRSHPAFAHRVVRWIETAAGQTSAKFVISLRSEYEYQLRDLHTRPFTKRHRIEIPPIENPQIIEAIIAGDPMDPDDRMPIDEAACRRLVEAWTATQADERTNAWNRPGLLHLQATLYVLWMARELRTGGRYGGEITGPDANRLVVAYQASLDARKHRPRLDEDRSLFGYGLERSVAAAISNCERACEPAEEWTGLARVVHDQTRWIFRDISQHLASGGFKTQLDVWDLALRVLGYLDEPDLKSTPAWVAELYRDPDWLGRSVPDPETTRSSFASGPAAALSSQQLLFELYRCYFFALEWMRQANIVQILPSGTSYRVTLTHDRFSEGLSSWREAQTQDFVEATRRYVAQRGKVDLHWTPEQLEAGLGPDRMVANIRWRQCIIRDTEFADVTFVNCDFAGSVFDTCSFNGATFVNCVLDDVDFVRCDVGGAPAWRFTPADWADLDKEERRPKVEDPPEFDLRVGADLGGDLVALTGPPIATKSPLALHSPVSPDIARVIIGQAAVLATEVTEPEPELPQQRGGLVMCGGRLSSLTFRECTFLAGAPDAPPATVALRHIAGTSLELGDQSHGRFEIFAAAIRGFTVTRRVGSTADPTGTERFTFDVRHAKIINAWFGVDLLGTAFFHDCNVWQLINASDPGIEVTLDDTAYFGLINTDEVTDLKSLPLGIPLHGAPPHFAEDGLSDMAKESLRQVSENIDFRET